MRVPGTPKGRGPRHRTALASSRLYGFLPSFVRQLRWRLRRRTRTSGALAPQPRPLFRLGVRADRDVDVRGQHVGGTLRGISLSRSEAILGVAAGPVMVIGPVEVPGVVKESTTKAQRRSGCWPRGFVGIGTWCCRAGACGSPGRHTAPAAQQLLDAARFSASDWAVVPPLLRLVRMRVRSPDGSPCRWIVTGLGS
jgi:hypothetical protein